MTYKLYRDALRDKARKLVDPQISMGPPYNPWLIAKILDVQVQQEDLKGIDGYVEVIDGNYRAVIGNSADVRMRFTLAHELGHVVLMRSAAKGQSLALTRFRAPNLMETLHQDPEEEALCNDFAAELLMPFDQVKPLIQHTAHTPTAVWHINRKFRVSIQAAATRIVDIEGRFRSAVSLWDRTTRWPMPIWWSGFKLAAPEMTKLESFVANDWNPSFQLYSDMKMISVECKRVRNVALVVLTCGSHKLSGSKQERLKKNQQLNLFE